MCSKLPLQDNRSFKETDVSRTEIYKGYAKLQIVGMVSEYVKCEEEDDGAFLAKIVEEYTFPLKTRSEVYLTEKLRRRSVYDLKSNRLLTAWVNQTFIVPNFILLECSRNIEKINKHIEECKECASSKMLPFY